MPGIAVNVVVVHQGQVLLTQREDLEVWCLPSGGVEMGESRAEFYRRALESGRLEEVLEVMPIAHRKAV